MKSYKYHEGIWAAIEEPLPREVDERHDPFSLDDSQEAIARTYSKRNILKETYERAFAGLGFTDKKRQLDCPLGRVQIYARDHVDLPAKRGTKECAYDFLCVLRFAGSYIRVWIVDLPNLFLFLREIEAHEPVEKTNELADVIEKIFNDSDVQELLVYLKWLVGHMDDGKLEIAIKQPAPKKR